MEILMPKVRELAEHEQSLVTAKNNPQFPSSMHRCRSEIDMKEDKVAY